MIAKLESEGASTAEVENLLEAFEITLKLFEEQYQSIKQEIDTRLGK
jgi:hypothetical protein